MPKAVALKYDFNAAPTVVAKGSGLLADKILAVAKENDVLLHQSPELVEMLSTLELGEEIPESLYLAVAEVIAFAHKIKDHQW
ncbi:flagellar biosynthesis protein FlhB [Marinomonas rhizomae]|nr:EscU/YscU/HrcU family type III secretion system export apparatus switch protein [Marinomonas rhizomae]RNF73067.1 flagellar biosynthesis protein FlhB [Marinomonas rhizomae]